MPPLKEAADARDTIRGTRSQQSLPRRRQVNSLLPKPQYLGSSRPIPLLLMLRLTTTGARLRKKRGLLADLDFL
jgi:hypothetical protein